MLPYSFPVSHSLFAHPWLNRVVFPSALLASYFVVPVNADDAPVGVLIGIVISVVSLGIVSALVFREAMSSDRRLGVIHLVLALELVLIIFSFAYYIIADNGKNEIVGISTRLDALYFSVTTVSTVGYGDIHATGQLARGLVTLNIAFNLAFVASLVNLIRERVGRDMVEPDRGRHMAAKKKDEQGEAAEDRAAG